MQFDTLDFLIFLPVFFGAYWALNRLTRAQNLFVIAGSYLFYGWADWRYLFLIISYTAWSYWGGLTLGRLKSRRWRAAVLWATVAADVGVLGLYKYFDFFVGNFNRLFLSLGLTPDWPTLNLVLPIGISFYTFQALSYTIDVYRRKIEPARDWVAFFAFISFFPQLVAGPIERAGSLLPQMERRRRFTYGDGVVGMKRILWGLFKKMVVADNCGAAVNRIFDGYASADSLNLLLGAVFFSFQVYCDFSGYSDIAIGCGRLLGIRLMENFRMPYFARDVKAFWQRWHISLNRWLIDYIYIPLGGSRRGFARTLANVMVVCVVSGAWHGASWNYIGWGCYCGLTLIAYDLYLRYLRPLLPSPRWPGRVEAAVSVALTLFVTLFGMIIFRSRGLSMAAGYISGMCSFTPFGGFVYDDTPTLLVILAFFVAVEFVSRHAGYVLRFPDRGVFGHRAVRWGVMWLIVMAIAVFRGDIAEFMYFQF